MLPRLCVVTQYVVLLLYRLRTKGTESWLTWRCGCSSRRPLTSSCGPWTKVVWTEGWVGGTWTKVSEWFGGTRGGMPNGKGDPPLRGGLFHQRPASPCTYHPTLVIFPHLSHNYYYALGAQRTRNSSRRTFLIRCTQVGMDKCETHL